MDTRKDAYGQELWAHFRGKRSYELIEREDGFFALSGGSSAYFQEFKNWPVYQKKAIAYARGRVLDIGAGAGRVSLHLQKKGLKVTAMDNSPLAAKVCKRRGIKNILVLPIEKLGKLGKVRFDTVVMYGNNFGLFGSFKKAKLLLRKLHRLTTPEGIIIAESNDPYKTGNPLHLSYQKMNRKRERMSGQLRLRVCFRRYVGPWFDYLIVSKREMKEIIRGTGWKVEHFVDSGKSPYIAILIKE